METEPAAAKETCCGEADPDRLGPIPGDGPAWDELVDASDTGDGAMAERGRSSATPTRGAPQDVVSCAQFATKLVQASCQSTKRIGNRSRMKRSTAPRVKVVFVRRPPACEFASASVVQQPTFCSLDVLSEHRTRAQKQAALPAQARGSLLLLCSPLPRMDVSAPARCRRHPTPLDSRSLSPTARARGTLNTADARLWCCRCRRLHLHLEVARI